MSRIEEALAKASKRQAVTTPQAAGRKPDPLPNQDDKTPAIDNDKLVVLNTPASPEAEEFRKIKESLFKSCHEKGCLDNVFMITSPGSAEGKTLVSVNLAISLAQEYDHTVLLVDGDLRKPSCHKLLEIPHGPGLAECLTDGASLSDVLVNTGIGKLKLLRAGKPLRNHLEVFSSNGMRELLREVKNRYHDRIVLIDTPPVLLFAETRTLASQVDGVILIVREGDTSLEDIQESMELIGDKVRGLVYNATEFVQARRFSYYHYSLCTA